MEVSLIHLALVIVIVVYIYCLITWNYDYFHDKPIPSLRKCPLLGSTAPLLLKKVTFADFTIRIYNKFPGVKVFGMFDAMTPFFVIRDPELIKQLAIKDFDYFCDRMPFLGEPEDTDDHPYALLKRMLVTLKGHRWRNMRATLSPAFTGRKMRLMFALMVDCSGQMMTHFEGLMGESGRIQIEAKDMLSRFTMNVIASCAFGIGVNCFKEDEHEFMYHGKRILDFASPEVIAKGLFLRLFPTLGKKWGVDVMNQEQAKYFTKLIKDTVRDRQSQGIVRHDMIDLLLEARKGILKYEEEQDDANEGFATVLESDVGKTQLKRSISEIDMIAQCVVFFLAGFDPVATSCIFIIYELILNPDIQQRLYEEVRLINNQLEGKTLTYEALQGMKYMCSGNWVDYRR